jgi:uncharacterized membrane protein SpoIIM required for sporulation
LNGYVLRDTLSRLFSVDSKLIIALVLTHAIFEIPAIIIAGAAGFKIPYEIIRYLAGRKGQKGANSHKRRHQRVSNPRFDLDNPDYNSSMD